MSSFRFLIGCKRASSIIQNILNDDRCCFAYKRGYKADLLPFPIVFSIREKCPLFRFSDDISCALIKYFNQPGSISGSVTGEFTLGAIFKVSVKGAREFQKSLSFTLHRAFVQMIGINFVVGGSSKTRNKIQVMNGICY